MKEEEKERKFHESLLKMLYPPPPSPPSDQDDDEEEGKKFIQRLHDLPEEDPENVEGYSSPLSSDKDEGENDSNGKLTRAQRKRLRKRRLKEAASQRRKIIGPLLPESNNNGNSGSVEVVDNEPKSVRQNASTEISVQASCSKRNKLKQRRKSRKLAGEKLNSSIIENSDSHHGEGV